MMPLSRIESMFPGSYRHVTCRVILGETAKDDVALVMMCSAAASSSDRILLSPCAGAMQALFIKKAKTGGSGNSQTI